MSELKMSDWFKLPVSCMLQLNGDSPHTSQDSILFDGVNVMTGHHAEKVEIAINSHEKLTEENKRLREALVCIKNAKGTYDDTGFEEVLDEIDTAIEAVSQEGRCDQ